MLKTLGVLLGFWCVAACLSACGAVCADTVSYSTHVPLPQPFATQPRSDLVSLPRFDPALGQLNSISIGVPLMTCAMAYEHRSTRRVATVSLGMGWSTGTFDLPDGIMSDISATLSDLGEDPILVPVYDGVTDYGGASGHTFTYTYPACGSGAVSGAAAVDYFTGLTAFTVPFSRDGQGWGQDDSGNVWYAFESLMEADVVVTYDFAPVPEPASLMVLITGVAGVVLRRRAN